MQILKRIPNCEVKCLVWNGSFEENIEEILPEEEFLLEESIEEREESFEVDDEYLMIC